MGRGRGEWLRVSVRMCAFSSKPPPYFSEICQELLHASRFILGTSERDAFCIMLVGELNKNGCRFRLQEDIRLPGN